MGFQMLRYPESDTAGAAIDGKALLRDWSRYVGSVHRHWQTGELILCWSPAGPHRDERERMRQILETEPGAVAAVLSAVDQRDSVLAQQLAARVPGRA